MPHERAVEGVAERRHVCRPRDGDDGLTFWIALFEWGDEARAIVRERLCAVCGGLIVDWPVDERGT